MKSNRISIIHDNNGWNGLIKNEEEYMKLLLGESKFSTGDKNLATVTMPYEIFSRLFQLDRLAQGIDNTESPASNELSKISDHDINRLLTAIMSLSAYSRTALK